jgi:hypothetical protein
VGLTGVCFGSVWGERDFFMDNLLVRIHLIIEMISVDRPCALRLTLSLALAARVVSATDTGYSMWHNAQHVRR